MDTNKLIKWLGGGWIGNMGENEKIAQKNAKIAQEKYEETKENLEANWHKDD
jgi:hypothetical protein